jgi:hypothetical protein
VGLINWLIGSEEADLGLPFLLHVTFPIGYTGEPLTTFPQLHPALLQQIHAGEKSSDLFFYLELESYFYSIKPINQKI